MIRFIDLGDQILEDTKRFAWFDTVTDTFEEFNCNQTWDGWKDFKYDYNANIKALNAWKIKLKPIERYKRLFQWRKGK